MDQLAQSYPVLCDQDGQQWRIKDGKNSPLVWKVKHVMLHVKDEVGLPTTCYHLLVRVHPLTGEQKYFLSNARRNVRLKDLLRAAFSRWPIGRCFEDQKGEVGLTHWGGGRGWACNGT